MKSSFISGLLSGGIAAATQMSGVMANTESTEVTQTLIITTCLAFIIHSFKEWKGSLSERKNTL